MLMDYLGAVLLIFFAEMGDKTQFLAMAFATKYPVKKILIGVGIGAFLNHGMAMLLGKALLQLMPGNLISFIAGMMFLFFAFQSLSIEEEEIEESTPKFGPVVTVALAFFLGELGDKTQLSALGLSVDAHYVFLALLGTTTGMIITSSMGIFVGLKLGKKIPEDKLKLSAFIMFLIFGLQKVHNAYLNQLSMIFQWVIVGLVLAFSFYAGRSFLHKYKTVQESTFLKQAERLRQTKDKIELKVASMCNGLEVCGVCDGEGCLVGYMRKVLTDAQVPIHEDVSLKISKLKNKAFDAAEAKVIIEYLMSYYNQHPSEFENNITLRHLRHSAEYIIMNKMISTDNYDDYKREIQKYL
ncbi:MAG: TMEM165/GDT1 family protein [Clostridia bacterium]|nr:TMEM165/GDT1 family protein [Clostridia bacterium]